MILALNTASKPNGIALLDGASIIYERRYTPHADEARRLFLGISQAMASGKLQLNALTGIVVVDGPGTFSAVRVGVTTANIIGALSKIPLYALDLPTLERLQREGARTFGQAARAFIEGKPDAEKIIKPRYYAPPNITKSPKCHGLL